MKTLIFGGKGYLGQYFKELYPDAVTPSVDIADAQAVAAVLDSEQPDTVINCAGKTGRPNVDWCETHKLETVHSNVTGPLVLLDECTKRNIYWVHLGSGCVYHGDERTLFTEEDRPNFYGSFYSRTKGYIDEILKEFPLLNLRLRMPFDATSGERSLISKLIKYERVLDVKNSMTYLPDLMQAAKTLLDNRTIGTFNVVNPGAMSPYQIMQMYQEIVDPSHTFELLKLEELPEVATAGRSNCVLDGSKLAKEGIAMRPVEDAVREALEMLKQA